MLIQEPIIGSDALLIDGYGGRKEGAIQSLIMMRGRDRERDEGRRGEEEANGLHVEMELLIRFRCKGCLEFCIRSKVLK